MFPSTTEDSDSEIEELEAAAEEAARQAAIDAEAARLEAEGMDPAAAAAAAANGGVAPAEGQQQGSDLTVEDYGGYYDEQGNWVEGYYDEWGNWVAAGDAAQWGYGQTYGGGGGGYDY